MPESWMDWIKNGEIEHYRASLEASPADVNAVTPEGVPAVRYAVYYDHPEIAEMLVGMGADLDLFSAAALGKLEILKHVLAADPACIGALSSDGYPALGLACFFNHTECASFLLEQGAPVNQTSNNPQHVMPIHAATAARSAIITAMLLAHGADANAVQSGGFTPLHAAAQNGDLEIARLLLQAGADPSAVNDSGHTPVDIARSSHFDDLVSLLTASAA